MGQLYGFVVFDCKINPEYFLDNMSSVEVSYVAESYVKAYRDKWEMLRLNNHAIFQSQSSKEVSIEKILKFGWDKENRTPQRTQEENKAQIARIKKRFKLN